MPRAFTFDASMVRPQETTLDFVRLWRVNLDVRPEVETRLCDLLCHREVQRAEDIQSPSVRRRYVVARGTLRQLLGSLLDRPPRSLAIEPGPAGKPRLVGAGDTLRFSLSHSADMAMIGVSSSDEVGVDLEHLRPIPAAAGIARRLFSRREADFVGDGGPSCAAKRFLLCWTRKEALGKALGSGLSFDLLRLEMPLASGGGAVSVEGFTGGSAEPYHLLDVPLGSEQVASLAMASSHPGVTGTLVLPRHRFESDNCSEVGPMPTVSELKDCEFSPRHLWGDM
jgi:phosphopantetheinyl transferase